MGAVGMATAGLKLPELKAELKRIVKQLDTEEGQLQLAMIMEESSESDSDETGGGGQKKTFTVQNDTHGYRIEEGYEVKNVGSSVTKLSDTPLKSGGFFSCTLGISALIGATWFTLNQTETQPRRTTYTRSSSWRATT